MRRSKSNPAKYARNYRAISQRRMTQYDDLDEEKEMQRLKDILKHSEDHLKKYGNNNNDTSDDNDDKHSKKAKKKRKRVDNDKQQQEDSSSTREINSSSTNPTGKISGSADVEADIEATEIERARNLLRNSTAHLSKKSNTEQGETEEDMQLKPLKSAKKRNRKQSEKATSSTRDGEEAQNSKSTQKLSQEDTSSNGGRTVHKDATALLLSEDFFSENNQLVLNDYGGSMENPLVVASKKKKQQHARKKLKVQLSPEEIRQAKKLQKQTERKLKQLATRAEQKKNRSELYDKLQKTSISEEEMALMSSSAQLGKRMSKKEQLKRLVQKERAGIELTSEERDLLYRDRATTGNNEGETETSDDKADTQQQVPMESKPKEERKKETEYDRPKKKEEQSNSSSNVDNEAMEEPDKDEGSSTTKALPTQDSDVDAQAGSSFNPKSFAAQMMASLSTLKSTSEKQKEENQLKKEQEAAERKRLEEERLKNAPKSEPYRVKDPIVIQTAATKRNLQVHRLPSGSRRVLHVERPAAVQESRYDLPVTQMEFEVIDAIRNNDVTIICGETGSGKSTQVPQLLYESGFTLDTTPGTKPVQDSRESKFLIGVTQPRRVAAVSTAKRVCFEMGKGDGNTIKSLKREEGNLVAYQTRYETAGLGQKTAIKFMTDGILLQEIQSDLLLRKYNVIVLDECHERNLNCDILCGLIGLALPLRKKAAEEAGSNIPPLKLVIMSATLRVDDFVNNRTLFPSTSPFVVKIPGRTFPVTIHHSKVTELDNYEDAAFQKVCKIHRKLPQGGILVFLTGKHEIVRMVTRLRKALSRKERTAPKSPSTKLNDVLTLRTDINYANESTLRDLDDDEVDGDLFNSGDGEDNFENSSEDENNDTAGEAESDGIDADNVPKEVMVLPLYSMLSAEEQTKVFASPPEGCRLIVVSTNIAETSITIPSISYVVDTGRQKSKNYDAKTGVASFDISWISKAAANQRAGRAGRTGPGHCYRLYSSSMFSRHMDDFALPEVLTRPLEDVVLAMKAMKISSISKFPFPTPPAESQIDAAVKLLANLGCVNLSSENDDGEITPLGAAISTFPLGVRCGKMLLVAAHAGVLDYAIAIVAALSEKSPFLRVGVQSINEDAPDKKEDSDDESDAKPTKEKNVSSKWTHRGGDIYAVMLAIGAYTYAGNGAGGISEKVACKQFCQENGLNHVIMERMQKIRVHLSRLVNTRMTGAEGVAAKTGKIPHSMKPPNKVQERLLLQVIVSGLLDNVAMLAPLGSIPGSHHFSLRSAFLSCSSSIKEPLFMDRNSVLFSRDARRLPQWVCYEHLIRKNLKDGTPIATMKNVTPVDASWLGSVAKGGNLLSVGGPVASPRPTYDSERDEVLCSVETKFGCHHWEIPPAKMRMYDALCTPEAKHSVHFRSEDTFRYFARFLLEGKVLPDLKELASYLNDNPSIVTSKTPVGKVGLIVSALSNARIDSASKLRRHWADVDNKFLLKTLKSWVKPKFIPQAKKLWIDTVKKECAKVKSANSAVGQYDY